MIFDSCEWKKDLRKEKRQILLFNRKLFFDIAFNYTYHKLEKSLFYSAFVIRKMVESKKLTDNIDNYKIDCKLYSPIKEINRINRHHIDKNYNFESLIKTKMQGKNICNSLIHSYACFLIFEEKSNAIGFYVVSDYDRNTHLIEVSVNDWFEYMECVIKDHVNHMETRYIKNKSDYVVIKKK